MSVFQGTVCLDITRTVSRAGAGAPSGVDRVERAYIREVLEAEEPLFLSRVLGGFVLLDGAAMRTFLRMADAPDALDGPDMLSRLGGRQTLGQKRAESTVRRLAKSFARRAKLTALLKAAAPGGFDFLTVGHSNQSPKVYAGVRSAGARRVVTLVHDVIPLDYPEFSRPAAVPRFTTQFKAMAGESHLLIFNSAYTEARARHWMQGLGVDCATATALLGCDPLPNALTGPTDAPAHPNFVVLGTIEPRKNHILLLNIWRRFHDTMAPDAIPHLHIVGRRGWENENVVDVLERAPFMGQTVFEHGFLSDEELAALLQGATALLFPSFVEGFG
ncbi:MAG: glycosyltransferase, partial [Pseudomonadota bacterium]